MWSIGVQVAPTTFLPSGPTATHSRSTSNLPFDDPQAGHDRAIELGARMLYADDLDTAVGHRATSTQLVIRSSSVGGSRRSRPTCLPRTAAVTVPVAITRIGKLQLIGKRRARDLGGGR